VKRILTLLLAVAFMVTMLAVAAMPAMAHTVPACENSQGAAPEKNPHCQKDHHKKDHKKKDHKKKDYKKYY
jgi:Ni/Co efflux regulator RcnB